MPAPTSKAGLSSILVNRMVIGWLFTRLHITVEHSPITSTALQVDLHSGASSEAMLSINPALLRISTRMNIPVMNGKTLSGNWVKILITRDELIKEDAFNC